MLYRGRIVMAFVDRGIFQRLLQRPRLPLAIAGREIPAGWSDNLIDSRILTAFKDVDGILQQVDHDLVHVTAKSQELHVLVNIHGQLRFAARR